MHRFFVDPSQIQSGRAFISGPDVAHITRVLRMQPGDALLLCDGCGQEYTAHIAAIADGRVDVTIGAAQPARGEPRGRVTLYQGFPKGDKLESIIQKSTEIGVISIVPVVMEHSVAIPKGQGRLERWRRVALEAAKQCGRGVIPQVSAPLPFGQALAQLARHTLALAAFEQEQERHIGHHTPLPFDIGLLIGPEGGLSAREAKVLTEAGVHTISLGPRILRTETAGPTALAILLHLLGDMGGV